MGPVREESTKLLATCCTEIVSYICCVHLQTDQQFKAWEQRHLSKSGVSEYKTCLSKSLVVHCIASVLTSPVRTPLYVCMIYGGAITCGYDLVSGNRGCADSSTPAALKLHYAVHLLATNMTGLHVCHGIGGSRTSNPLDHEFSNVRWRFR